jgi:PQQ-dependent dehydrogenase (methanol/ethanol family)
VAFDGKIFIGEAGAEFGTIGHVYAFDAATGKHVWTFDFIPSGETKAAATWGKSGAAHGGGSTWSSYAIDPEKRLLYVPVGNPAPDYNPAPRPGANLFTNSVVALDVNTGKLAWYAQQVSHDTHDWDTAAAPILYDVGKNRYMAVTNKGGWLYLYDRDRQTLLAQKEVSAHENTDRAPTKEGVHACPGNGGGVEWNGPAFSPSDGALFVNSVEWCGVYTSAEPRFEPALLYNAGDFSYDPIEKAYGWLRSFDAATGKENWRNKRATPMLAGVTPTAGGIVMTGDLNGDFEVFDSTNGKLLYRFNTGGAIAGGVSTYLVNGKQYVAVASGNASRAVWRTTGSPTVFVFALPEHE